MRLMSWIWWISVILLFLRSNVVAEESSSEINDIQIANSTVKEEKKPKTAADLNVHRCENSYDCVHGGVCQKGSDGFGMCMCPKACPATIPSRCGFRLLSSASCLLMNEDYRSKYDVLSPVCHHQQCVCPPQFDEQPVRPHERPLRINTTIPPMKCDKRELSVVGKIYPSTSVPKGTDVVLFCCLNMDPEGFVDAAGVFFVQNATIMREATGHPFKENHRKHDRFPCWELEIKNAQQSDSGNYMCIVTASQPTINTNFTIDFEVKAPRMIHKLRVNASEKEATVSWESDLDNQGNSMAIDLRLVRRTDNRGHVVFSQDNSTSPVVLKDLRAATPYTLFVSGKDGNVPFEFTEHFSTSQKRPFAPKEEDVRVLNSGSSLTCEVEWKAPAETNGRITKYFVSLRGGMRKMKPDGSLSADDFPPASEIDKRCANWDGEESKAAQAGINPIDFSTDFFSCKFGPLKPNRNYSVSVWAENTAGRSPAAIFKKTCLTNYAQPDRIEEPQTIISQNQSTFSLGFGSAPDDINGPISCYYIAIVPLPANISLDDLPPTSEIVMDSFSKVFTNNLNSIASDKKRYFAYVAESYSSYPKETIIGDGGGIEGVKPCNVQYLSRYSAEDLALRTGLKYTGFLIVRVDKEEERREEKGHPVTGGGKHATSRTLQTEKKEPASSRKQRQLHLSGPAYGYSGYFKPILLDVDAASSGGVGTALIVFLSLLVFVAMATGIAMFFVRRRGQMMWQWCPFSKMLSKDLDRVLLKQTFGAVPVDDLPTEYVIRHRDSDFVFVQEYEALPHYSLDTSASNRKENAHKNRYNDIKAFDETRVKLSKINGEETSDYINANFIKSWNEKKMFIAAQAPVDSTVTDFWRMIWEQESLLIVMVANLTEKNRQQCSKYWPDEEITRYGDLIVHPVDASYFSDYSIRTFDVVQVEPGTTDANGTVEYANVPISRTSQSFGANTRRITQYHFTNWNDYKAPECTTGMLRFLHILRELPEFNEAPVVIHCSAGVGRTGTFITIDSMFDQCVAEGKANVFEFVAGLRKQRNLMVQSVEQYVFIYKALAEWHMYGYTDMDLDQFDQHYLNLTEPSLKDRAASFNGAPKNFIAHKSNEPQMETGMEEEFKKLDRNLSGPMASTFAGKDENMMKNRFEASVPYDKYRVILSPSIGYANSTYINASHIKGYFYSYIVAQDPVSEMTVFDFWRMIADQKIATVVMLSNEEDWSETEKYWPDEIGGKSTYTAGRHSVDVSLDDAEAHKDFVERTLTYSMKDTEVTEEQEIVQFAYNAWQSDQLVPESSTSILGLISKVLERQSKLPDSGPILVHCRNGSSETGVFVCISLLLLRLKAEQRIDVFQTVKGLQNQRPMMFTKLDQYSFCYRTIAEYIAHSRGPLRT